MTGYLVLDFVSESPVAVRLVTKTGRDWVSNLALLIPTRLPLLKQQGAPIGSLLNLRLKQPRALHFLRLQRTNPLLIHLPSFTFVGFRSCFLSRFSSFNSFLVSLGASDRFFLGLSQGYRRSHLLFRRIWQSCYFGFRLLRLSFLLSFLNIGQTLLTFFGTFQSLHQLVSTGHVVGNRW